MCDCGCFNKDNTPIKDCGGTSRPQLNKKGPDSTNFVQLMSTEIKKALHTHMHKDRKQHTHELDSDSESNDIT